MGIITAIISVIGTVFSIVVNIIGSIAKALPWWVWLLPIGMIAGIYLVSGPGGCSCKDFGCGCRRHRDPRPPRVITYGPYQVKSVDSGLGLTVQLGRRRTQQVILDNIVLSTDPALTPLSKDHLAGIAGQSVTVQVEKTGLFRGTPDDNAQSSRLPLEPVASTGQPDADGTVEARGPWKDCPICKGTGVDVIDGEKMGNAIFSMFMAGHMSRCEACRNTQAAKPGSSLAYCDVAQAKWSKIEEDYKDFKPYKQPCMCINTSVVEGRSPVSREMTDAEFEKMEAELGRGPLSGTVTGASGINLNLAQIEGGYAKCSVDAPADWKAAEKVAKKKKLGLWSKGK